MKGKLQHLHKPQPRLMVHGYGLLDENRDIIAGSRMSGLALYTTLMIEGLSPFYSIMFLCGALRMTGAAPRDVNEDLSVYEYDARFPHYLECDGVFDPHLANHYYHACVAEPDNPIYRQLASSYAHAVSVFCPDIVNVHNPNAACAAIHATLGGIVLPPVVVTIHDVQPAQIDYLARHQERITQFISISRSVEEALLSAGIAAGRIRTIPNGIELASFLETRDVTWRDVARHHGLPECDAFNIIVPARRVRGKGIELAIHAFGRLARRHSTPMRLLISGAGLAEQTYEDELRSLACSVATAEDVFFLDAVSYSQMPDLFKIADVSLLPSTTPEGFGYANIEAMATGGPVVVCTDHGGPLDYIRHEENGLLIPPRNTEAIVGALERVMNASVDISALKANAKETALLYTKEAMVLSYHERLQGILAERGRC